MKVVPSGGAVKRIGLESLGWTLVVLGIILMPLPGPGLLIVLGGVALLSQQYEWADRRLTEVRLRAMREAARSVSGPIQMTVTLVGVATLTAAGVLWIVGPPVPTWWSLPESWWLPGGDLTGALQIGSALFALGLMVYSYRRFHGNPAEVAALEAEMDEADDYRTGGSQDAGEIGRSRGSATDAA